MLNRFGLADVKEDGDLGKALDVVATGAATPLALLETGLFDIRRYPPATLAAVNGATSHAGRVQLAIASLDRPNY